MGSDDLGALLVQAKTGDQGALARLLTAVERLGLESFQHLPMTSAPKPAFRLGITGPPGAGKSTLVGHLLRKFRQENKRLAVLAVDPSSPFSHGAILGDRIRYQEVSVDGGLFIRSIGTRGSLGGLSAAAYLMLRVFDLVGFDLVLIETVGVGQTELEVVNVADLVAVVLVPESGDSVQAMKAGLMEIADLFIVNKFDRPGAESLKRELEFVAESVNPTKGEKPQVLATVATAGQGVDVLVQKVLQRLGKTNLTQLRKDPRRLQEEARSLARQEWERQSLPRWRSILDETSFLRELDINQVKSDK